MEYQIVLFFICMFMCCAVAGQPVILSTPVQSSHVVQTPDSIFHLALAQAHTEKEGVLISFFKSKNQETWEQHSFFEDEDIKKIYAYAYGVADTVPVLFAAADDGNIKLYDYYDGDWRFADRFEAHEGAVVALAALDYNRDVFVVSAGIDNTVALWKQTLTQRDLITRLTLPATKRPVILLTIEAGSNNLELTRNFIVKISHEDNNVTLWDITSFVKS